MKKAYPLLILIACLALLSGCGTAAQSAAPTASPAITASPEATETPEPSAAPTPTPTAVPTPSPEPEPTPCPHELWVNGVCQACGEVCEHPAWENGRCTVCAAYCPHPEHDRNTMVCTQCGQVVPHNFLNSRCDMCGLEPVFLSETVARSNFYMIGSPRGTVESVTYLTHDYYTEGLTRGYAPLTKRMLVYLPADYDPSQRYDLMILMHGMGGTETYWLQDPQRITNANDSGGVYTRFLLDNLMASGYCRKMIIACPCFYRDSEDLKDYDRSRDEAQFSRELAEDILPFLVERYSTYARSSSRADISAARAHFAYAGLSMGSIYAFTSIIPNYLDMFAWFGCFCGSDAHLASLIPALNSEAAQQYPILFFYNCIGSKDSMFNSHYDQYHDMVARVDGLTDGVNAAFTEILKTNHDYRAWGTGLYNFLRVVFAQPIEH